jgi:hypothetical protein
MRKGLDINAILALDPNGRHLNASGLADPDQLPADEQWISDILENLTAIYEVDLLVLKR